MIKPRFESLVADLQGILPDGLARSVSDMASGIPKLPRDLEQQLQVAVQSAVRRAMQDMDVVTREDFDIQARVLARTRANLEAMEARVTELEERLLKSTN